MEETRAAAAPQQPEATGQTRHAAMLGDGPCLRRPIAPAAAMSPKTTSPSHPSGNPVPQSAGLAPTPAGTAGGRPGGASFTRAGLVSSRCTAGGRRGCTGETGQRPRGPPRRRARACPDRPGPVPSGTGRPALSRRAGF